jgi:hypothetical protein
MVLPSSAKVGKYLSDIQPVQSLGISKPTVIFPSHKQFASQAVHLEAGISF